MNLNYLLYAASFFLMISFIPLLSRIFKTKSSMGVSSSMMLLGLVQSLCFITYDVYFARYTMVIPFTILAIFFCLSLALTFIYKQEA